MSPEDLHIDINVGDVPDQWRSLVRDIEDGELPANHIIASWEHLQESTIAAIAAMSPTLEIISEAVRRAGEQLAEGFREALEPFAQEVINAWEDIPEDIRRSHIEGNWSDYIGVDEAVEYGDMTMEVPRAVWTRDTRTQQGTAEVLELRGIDMLEGGEELLDRNMECIHDIISRRAVRMGRAMQLLSEYLSDFQLARYKNSGYLTCIGEITGKHGWSYKVYPSWNWGMSLCYKGEEVAELCSNIGNEYPMEDNILALKIYIENMEIHLAETSNWKIPDENIKKFNAYEGLLGVDLHRKIVSHADCNCAMCEEIRQGRGVPQPGQIVIEISDIRLPLEVHVGDTVRIMLRNSEVFRFQVGLSGAPPGRIIGMNYSTSPIGLYEHVGYNTLELLYEGDPDRGQQPYRYGIQFPNNRGW